MNPKVVCSQSHFSGTKISTKFAPIKTAFVLLGYRFLWLLFFKTSFVLQRESRVHTQMGGEHLIYKINILILHSFSWLVYYKNFCKSCKTLLHFYAQKQRAKLTQNSPNYSYTIWYKTRQIPFKIEERLIHKIQLILIHDFTSYIANKSETHNQFHYVSMSKNREGNFWYRMHQLLLQHSIHNSE